jgi:AcrR family transcriptional regulator
MARKKGKETDSKAALGEAAWELLLERGAAAMSVDAIVARAGLSKGTFFHFFPCKQDLLDAICARIAEESFRHAAAALERRESGPVERLDAFLRASREWRFEKSRAVGGLWLELSRDENAALLRRVGGIGVARLAPPVAALIAEGVECGAMRAADPEVTAQLVVEWMSATVEGSLRLFAADRGRRAIDLALRRANATLAAMERVLGMPEGSLHRVQRKVVAGLAAAVDREGRP